MKKGVSTMKLLFVLILFVCIAGLSYAENEEVIELTTYYPAPYGEYQDLQSERLSVGDVNGDGVIDSNDLPVDANVSIAVEGNIIAGDPTQADHVATMGWVQTSNAYDIADITVYNPVQVETGDVVLVDIGNVGGNKSGILLGGSVIGAHFKTKSSPIELYKIDITVDGVLYKYPSYSAFTEIEFGGPDDFCAVTLPGPIKFEKNLKIEYTAIHNNSFVNGIAYVIEN